MMNLDLIFPEIFLSLSIMTLLMIGVFKKKSENLVYNLSIITLAILFAMVVNLFTINEQFIFNYSYKIDNPDILTLPIIVLAAVFIYLEDRGGVFYSQKRCGKNGKTFYITKLRTMYLNSEDNDYQVEVSAGEGGEVEAVSSTFNNNDIVQLNASPHEHYQFVRWEGSDSVENKNSPTTTVKISEPADIRAIFTPILYTLNQ